jgi:hypothetical protein
MRRKLTILHLSLAAFFFPVALMFALTGGLYTIAIRGGYDQEVRQLSLAQPLTADLAALVALVQDEFAATGDELPSGGAGIKKAGNSFELEWTGVERDVILRPTADPLKAELVIKDTDNWRHFVQLHKAKGSDIAKGISVAWATALVLILVSGVIMGFTAPAFRGITAQALAWGFVAFLVYYVVG